MLTNILYTTLSTAIKGEPWATGNLFIAIGTGEPDWDDNPPVCKRNTIKLVNEIARKPVAENGAVYLDELGNPVSNGATARLRIATEFSKGEGEGTLRECGLYCGSATNVANTGTLLSYFVHPRIDKMPTTVLHRQFILNFFPTMSSPGQSVTRFLGNSHSQELHDLEAETAACQINKIKIDRRVYFSNAEQAITLGYDYCAFCFSRELSKR